MVLATFPLHMLSNTVFAGGEDTQLEKNIELSDASSVNNWMSVELGNLTKIDDINITLSGNITLRDTTNKMSDGYFFDFTDDRFTGKTITIAGGPEQDEQEMPSPHQITIDI